MWDPSLVLCFDTTGNQHPAQPDASSGTPDVSCVAVALPTLILSVSSCRKSFPFKQGQGTYAIQITPCESQPAPMAHLCRQSPEHLSIKPAGRGNWRALATKQQQIKALSTDLLSRQQKELYSPAQPAGLEGRKNSQVVAPSSFDALSNYLREFLLP